MKEKVDENVSRLNGLLSLLLLLLGIYSPYIWIVMLIDYLVRSLSPEKSLVTRVSKLIQALFGISKRPIDRSPKIFAARIGFTFATLVVVTAFLSFDMLNSIVVIMFAIAISLETFFNYCVGCRLYSILLAYRVIKNKITS